jgi:hypothetical protein
MRLLATRTPFQTNAVASDVSHLTMHIANGFVKDPTSIELTLPVRLAMSHNLLDAGHSK